MFYSYSIWVRYVAASTLLQSQQDLSILPQFLQIVKITLVGGEKMHDGIAKIHDHPAIAGESLFLSLFIILGSHVVNNGIAKRIDHAVAGAGTDNKIIGK
jgi:hypothetical protein